MTILNLSQIFCTHLGNPPPKVKVQLLTLPVKVEQAGWLDWAGDSWDGEGYPGNILPVAALGILWCSVV